MKANRIITALARCFASNLNDNSQMTADDRRRFAAPYMCNVGKLVRKRILVERAIARQVLSDAILQGYRFRLYDGEAFTTEHSMGTVAQGMDDIGATDEDRIYIYQQGEKERCIGSVYLVYGNTGHDVIADHTDSEAMTALLANATRLSELIEETFY